MSIVSNAIHRGEVEKQYFPTFSNSFLYLACIQAPKSLLLHPGQLSIQLCNFFTAEDFLVSPAVWFPVPFCLPVHYCKQLWHCLLNNSSFRVSCVYLCSTVQITSKSIKKKSSDFTEAVLAMNMFSQFSLLPLEFISFFSFLFAVFLFCTIISSLGSITQLPVSTELLAQLQSE